MDKKNNEFIFFNERLTYKLNRIIHFPMTLVCASAGAGKTTAVCSYLSLIPARTVWHYCEEQRFPVYYRQFCSLLSGEYSALAGEAEREEQQPREAAADCALLMKQHPRRIRTVYVMESKASVPEGIMTFLRDLSFQRVQNFHVIVISRAPDGASETEPDSNINVIGDGDFRLDAADMVCAFQRQGIPLALEEAQYLLLYCDGWMPLVRRFLGELRKRGKPALYREIETVAGTSLPAEEAVGDRRETGPEEALRLALERFDLEDAEIALHDPALRAHDAFLPAYYGAMLDMLSGRAAQALERLNRESARLYGEGKKREAARFLETSLQLRSYLGDRFYREAEELIGTFTDAWLHEGGRSGIAGCFSLLRGKEYGRLLAHVRDAEPTFRSELECYYRDFFQAISCMRMKKAKEGRAAFGRVEKTLWQREYYLAAFLLYDEVVEYIRVAKQQNLLHPNEDDLSAFLDYDEVARSLDPAHVSGAYWTENAVFKEKWACFRSSMKKNMGSSFLDIQWNLTAREREMLQYLRNGMTNNEIAQALYISENTVKTTLKSIFKKLGISSRKDLI